MPLTSIYHYVLTDAVSNTTFPVCLPLSLCSHEYISGYYRVSVYFLCKILSDIVTLRTIPAIVFSCVAYFMVGRWKTSCAILVFIL